MLEVLTINRAVMIDNAYRHAFGRAVEQKERSIIRAMHAVRLHFNFVTASNLTASVSLELGDCSKPTATKAIAEMVKKKFLVFKVDQENETRKHYSFSQGVIEKLRLVDELETEIAAVIAAQKADPSNVTAGKDLLSAPIYFHSAAEDKTEAIRENLLARAREFKSSNQNKRNNKDAA